MADMDEMKQALEVLDDAIREFASVAQGDDALMTDWVIGVSGQAYGDDDSPVSRYSFNHRLGMPIHSVMGLSSMLYDNFADTGPGFIAAFFGPEEGGDDEY